MRTLRLTLIAVLLVIPTVGCGYTLRVDAPGVDGPTAAQAQQPIAIVDVNISSTLPPVPDFYAVPQFFSEEINCVDVRDLKGAAATEARARLAKALPGMNSEAQQRLAADLHSAGKLDVVGDSVGDGATLRLDLQVQSLPDISFTRMTWSMIIGCFIPPAFFFDFLYVDQDPPVLIAGTATLLRPGLPPRVLTTTASVTVRGETYWQDKLPDAVCDAVAEGVKVAEWDIERQLAASPD